MTDKEKIELKDGVISIFKRFNILDHTATIGGLRDDILRYIDSLQEEPVSEDLEQAIDNYLATYFGSEKEKQDWPFLKKMAIHFANWQREKMIKNSIEVKVKSDKDGFYTTETWDEMNELLQKIGTKEGGKVHINIIKQEEE